MLKLELDLTQTESRYQLQKHIDTTAQAKWAEIVLMKDGQNERIQQADNFIDPYSDGYA